MIKKNIIYKNVILFWAILLILFLAVQLAHAQFYGDYGADFGSAGYDYGYGSYYDAGPMPYAGNYTPSYTDGSEPALPSVPYDSAPVVFVPAYNSYGYYPFDYGFVDFSLGLPGNFSVPAVSFTPGSSNFSVSAVGFAPGSSNFSVPAVSFTPGSSNISAPPVSFSPGASSFLVPAVGFSPGASYTYTYAAAPVAEASAAPQTVYAAAKPSGPAVAFTQVPKTGIADNPKIAFFLITILAVGAILTYLFMRMFIISRDRRGIFFKRRFFSRDILILFESIRITSYRLLSQIPTDEEIRLPLGREMASLKLLALQNSPDCELIKKKVVLLSELWSNPRMLNFLDEAEVKNLKSHLAEFQITIEGVEEEFSLVKDRFGVATM